MSQSEFEACEPSLDAFLNDSFKVYQPSDGGHRAGLDALLLSACVPPDASGILVDMGAGTGVAGLSALCTADNLEQCILVEKNHESCDLLRKSRNELWSSDLSNRIKIHETDIINLNDEVVSGKVHWVIANPPFNPQGYRVSPNENRAAAHQQGELGLPVWIDKAAKLLVEGGQFAIIFRPDSLTTCLQALAEKFGALRILPIAPRQGEPAKRIVVTGIKGRRTPLVVLPQFVLHKHDGTFLPSARDIFEGRMKFSF